MNDSFFIQIAGHQFELNVNCPETRLYFKDFLKAKDETLSTYTIPAISKDRFREVIENILQISYASKELLPWAEYQALSMPIYNLFLHLSFLPLHGLCFKFNEANKAVILSAPSGTGKTTQYLNWKKLFPDDITIINGDSSLIQMNVNEKTVYDNPWRGKEGYHNQISAPLGVFVYLEQGQENKISELTEREKVELLYPEVCYLPESEHEIDLVCHLLSDLLNSVKIYKFINTGTLESTIKLRKFIYEKLERN